MVLCFGVIGTIMKKYCPDSVSNTELVGALVGTVDPNNQYGDRDQAASRLLSCQLNFPTISAAKKEDDEYGSNRLTDIKNLAKVADLSEVAQRIQTQVLPLLDPDKKTQLVPALFEAISADPSLEAERRESFHRYTGTSAGELLTGKIVCLPRFLAGLLLYSAVVVANREGRKSILSMDELFFESALKNYPELEISEELDRKDKLHKSMPPFLSLDAGLEKKIPAYLDRGVKNLSTIKTLIFGDNLQDFEKLYVCNTLSGSSFSGRARHLRYDNEDRDILNVKEEDLEKIHNCIIISGMGGLGKSMMMRHLFLSSAKEYKEGKKLPVFITVRNFGEIEDQSFEDFVFSFFNGTDVEFTLEEMKDLLKFGRVFLLFDGLDEINAYYLRKFQTDLARFTCRYPDNMFVVSSRPMDSFFSLERFQVLDLKPLSDEQAMELIRKLGYLPEMPEYTNKFLERLEREFFRTHDEFAHNPLLLTIMFMTFVEFGDIPSKKYRFYEEAFAALSRKHDVATKGTYKRPYRTCLSEKTLEELFAEFCAKTYVDYCYDFSEDTFYQYFTQIFIDDKPVSELYSIEDLLYDLSINLCLLYYEGGRYHFIHRSFQEYFCALYFSWQMDETLEEIGEIFENRSSSSKHDETLSMLYAMIPEKMEIHCFRPFLQRKIKYYLKNLNYYTFLEDMYPYLIYQLFENVEVPDKFKEKNQPVSPLYAFIRDLFISEKDMDLQLPFVEEFIYEDCYMSTDEELGRFFGIRHNSKSTLFRENEKLSLIGYVFSFKVRDVLKNQEKYKEFLDALKSNDCALFREYEAMLQYYEKLEYLESKRHKPKKNIFESMIRRKY